jgi:hypothetical protein
MIEIDAHSDYKWLYCIWNNYDYNQYIDEQYYQMRAESDAEEEHRKFLDQQENWRDQYEDYLDSQDYERRRRESEQWSWREFVKRHFVKVEYTPEQEAEQEEQWDAKGRHQDRHLVARQQKHSRKYVDSHRIASHRRAKRIVHRAERRRAKQEFVYWSYEDPFEGRSMAYRMLPDEYPINHRESCDLSIVKQTEKKKDEVNALLLKVKIARESSMPGYRKPTPREHFALIRQDSENRARMRRLMRGILERQRRNRLFCAIEKMKSKKVLLTRTED